MTPHGAILRLKNGCNYGVFSKVDQTIWWWAPGGLGWFSNTFPAWDVTVVAEHQVGQAPDEVLAKSAIMKMTGEGMLDIDLKLNITD